MFVWLLVCGGGLIATENSTSVSALQPQQDLCICMQRSFFWFEAVDLFYISGSYVKVCVCDSQLTHQCVSSPTRVQASTSNLTKAARHKQIL